MEHSLLEALASTLCQAQCGPPGQGKSWSQVWDADKQPSTGRQLWLRVAKECLRQMEWAHDQGSRHEGPRLTTLAPPDWQL